MRIGNFVIKCAMAFIIGIVAVIYMLQQDEVINKHLASFCAQRFSRLFNCVAEGHITSINLLYFEIEASDINVRAADNTWLWYAKRMLIQASWLSLLMRHTLPLSITLEGLQAISTMHNADIAIINHIRQLIESEITIPISAERITIHKGHVILNDQEKHVKSIFNMNGETGIMDNKIKTSIYLSDISLTATDKQYIDKGSLFISIDTSQGAPLCIIDGDIELCQLQNNPKVCHINFDSRAGIISIDNKNSSFQVYGTMTSNAGWQSSVCIPVSYITSLFGSNLEIRGNIQAQLKGDSLSSDAHIVGLLKECHIGYQTWEDLRLSSSLDIQNFIAQGQCIASYNNINLVGKWLWDIVSHKGSCDLYNSSTVHIWPTMYWDCLPGNLLVHIDHADKQITGSCECLLTHDKIDAHSIIAAHIRSTADTLKLVGTYDVYSFELACSLLPFVRLEKCVIKDEQYQPIFMLTGSSDATIQGMLEYSFIKHFLSNHYGIVIPGEGNIKLTCALRDSMINMTAALENSNIRIPYTYNMIRNGTLTTTINSLNRKIAMNSTLLLDRGSILSKSGVIYYNDSGAIDYVFYPCIINKVFLNKDKDLFAMISGAVRYIAASQKEPELWARLIIDRAQLKRNIFSDQVHKQLLDMFKPTAASTDIISDIMVVSRNPVHIKTSFLDAQAFILLSIKGSSQNPHIAGTIDFKNGMLAFPYKPLNITHGSIYFLPGQWQDPAIELTAKGRVRKFHITLHISGSIQQPHIVFESSPPLTEEQIITLLLTGNEDGSLGLAMPQVILQNIKTVIFGPEQSPSKLEQYFKSFLLPLKHIRIVPGFTDETARGGFRGGIEVEVNEQLRGLIQKNFNLTEDTKFEVEYLLSDDVSLKGIKDERGDLGGEFEVRWKF